MDSSTHRIDITLHIKTPLTEAQTHQLLQTLSNLDGIGSMRICDASGQQLRLSFDPYLLSARDILKWFAQQTIQARLILDGDAGQRSHRERD